MSSTVAALEGLQQNDFLTVALLTVIAYDYVLTLPTEIDYIWNKRWTIVTALFLLVRYSGLYILMIYTLMWSSFFPGPEKVSETLWIASTWAFLVWIGASDLVMILRVWAMYNRSRLILGLLLTFWAIELSMSLLTCIMYPKNLSVAVTQVYDLKYCGVTSASATWIKVSAIPEIVNGAFICILVIYQFARRAFEMYRVAGKWHFNRYVNLFAGQSILYFVFVVLFNRTAIIVSEGRFQTEGWGSIALLPLEYVPAFALTPRFIMSVRALHPKEDLETVGRDTEVGFNSTVSHQGDRGFVSTLNVRRSGNDAAALEEEIPLEEWRLSTEERW